jgi:hypothetical protein
MPVSSWRLKAKSAMLASGQEREGNRAQEDSVFSEQMLDVLFYADLS